MRAEADIYIKNIKEKGFYAFYAYETARDLLLRKTPTVYKILTNADLSCLLKIIPSDVENRITDSHEMVISSDERLSFIIEDYPNLIRIPGILHGRDLYLKSASKKAIFSINAFFYDTEKEKFYDPLDSYSALKKGIIKTIDSPFVTGKKIPFLAMKTAKVYSETGFEIDEKLVTSLDDQSELRGYDKITREMARDFKEILVSDKAYESLLLLDRWGVLERILPEVVRLKEVEQDKEYHPEGNGFLHTLQCLKYVKKPNVNLMMALLLHDTGKADARQNKRNGKPFPNHSILSREISKKVLQRFYFNYEDTQEILFLVENHMILNAVDILPESRLRMIFDSPYIQNLFELYRADISSGFHGMESFYRATRKYRDYIKKQKLRKLGILS